MLTRAASGGGLPRGAAEDVGRAGLWLALRGQDGGGAALAAIRDGAAVAPLQAAAAVAAAPVMDGDTAVFAAARVAVCGMASFELLAAKAARRVRLLDVAAPLLLLGFAGLSEVDYGLRTRLVFSAAAGDGALAAGDVTITPAAGAAAAPACAPAETIFMDEETWRALELLARRCYVPAVGRTADAGAGLLDND